MNDRRLNRTGGIAGIAYMVAVVAAATLTGKPPGPERTADDAQVFIRDLASRLENRVQLTTDGLKLYINAVESAFAGDIAYAMLHKLYDQPDLADNERWYSPHQ